MYFLHSEFLSNLRLSWKTEFAREFFTVLNMYFLSFRIFEQLPLALKKQSCPENFHCIEYTFYIPDFEPLALALKDRGCHEYTVLNMYILLFRNFEQLAVALKNSLPWNFHCIEYVFFIIQDFWATWACPEKQSRPGIFHSIEYVFFIIQDFWATSGCPENRVCPENFQARGAAARPDPASYAYECASLMCSSPSEFYLLWCWHWFYDWSSIDL